MDALVDLSWRAYPGAAIVALGIAAFVHGLGGIAGLRRVPADEKPISFVSALRFAIIGAAVAGLGASWIWHQLWLFVLALAIGGEELLETSFVLYVLRWGRRSDAHRTTARPAA